VLKKGAKVPEVATGGLKTVAVRMPAHPIALQLIKQSGVPIAAPSANLSTAPSPTKAEHVINDLDGKVDLIIDGGDTALGIESTIIDMATKPYKLLRPGAFTVEDIERLVGKISVSKSTNQSCDSGVALSPGMKYKHYAPKKRLIAVDSRQLLIDCVNKMSKTGKIAVLCSNELAKEIRGAEVIELGSEKEPYEIARRLFDSFRLLDKTRAEIGLIQTFEQKGIGFAIMNRISKASSAYVRSAKELESACTAD
jgi:L-threonylcarbamoyladenylate synthase